MLRQRPERPRSRGHDQRRRGWRAKLAVSGSIELGLILSHVNELRKSFSDIELKILRGTGPQIVEYLKAGDAELAVGTSVGEAWDRLDSWKLFENRSTWFSVARIASGARNNQPR